MSINLSSNITPSYLKIAVSHCLGTTIAVGMGAILGKIYDSGIEPLNQFIITQKEAGIALRCEYDYKDTKVILPECNDPDLLEPTQLPILGGAIHGAIIAGAFYLINVSTAPLVNKVFNSLFPPQSLTTRKSQVITVLKNTASLATSVGLTYLFYQTMGASIAWNLEQHPMETQLIPYTSTLY